MEKRQKNNPIAVFDSGVGGISVLKELLKVMPEENYLFFGDSVNAPYGTKTTEQVRALTIRHATELFEEGAKGLVVACNTATSAAVRNLREIYPDIPIVGIEPAVKPAVEAKDHPTVLVLATPMTIREEKFQRLMERYENRGKIIPLPCPGLMDFVERGDLDGADLKKYLVELFYAYQNEKIDSVVLGCTHYPFVRDAIVETLHRPVTVFDGGEGTAREMHRRLEAAGLLCDRKEPGAVEFRNSLPDPTEKIALCRKLLSTF